MIVITQKDMDNNKEFFKQYQTKEWYELSGKIKARDNNTCQMCGCNDKPLRVHHLYYGEGGLCDVADSGLITLCEECHKLQHQYKNDLWELIQALRHSLTDLELFQILSDIFHKVINDGPFEWRGENLEPTKPFIEDMWSCDREIFINLLNWRKRVRIQENKEDAIRLWVYWHENGHKDRADEYANAISKWFKETYGKDIESEVY